MTAILNEFMSSLQVTDGLLETEHALVMLLLLFGLLIFKRKPLDKWVPAVVLSGIGLSLITPINSINFLWPVITAIIVPLLMWQAALAVAHSGPLRRSWSLLIWLFVLTGVSASLFFISGKPFAYALLIGILAVTLVWYFRELKVERSYLSTLGLISLAVLLLEIDVAVVSPRSWVGTLIAGIAFGLVVGFTGIYFFRRMKQPVWSGFFIVLAYAAYGVGLIFGVSPITSTLAAALAVATYGYSTRLWPDRDSIPEPGNSTFFFALGSVVWLLLGWQAHTEPAIPGMGGILIAMLVITVGILVIRNQVPLSEENRWARLLRKEVRVLLLLVGASLYWPLETTLTAWNVEIALLSAALLLILLRETIKPVFDLFGVELNWPSEG
jgi:hypothetical protein